MSKTPPDPLPDSSAEIPSSPYALETVTHLNADQLERLTGIFRDIGVDGWLEQHPLSRLELSKEVWFESRPVSGVYGFQTRVMQVCTQRAKSEYGQPFVWQSIYSVSSAGKDHREATQRTLVHELGHHIHAALGRLDAEQFLATTRAVILRGGTKYGRTTYIEYFAEAFALFVFHPTELLVGDSDSYAMIEKALKCVELEVKQQ